MADSISWLTQYRAFCGVRDNHVKQDKALGRTPVWPGRIQPWGSRGSSGTFTLDSVYTLGIPA